MNRKDVSNIRIINDSSVKQHKLHEDFISGTPPFLRGATSTMYLTQLWEINPSKDFSEKTFIQIPNNQQEETNTSIEEQVAQTLTLGLEHIKKEIATGIDIDTLCSKIIFTWNISNHHFKEIAKLRAARMLWAKLIQEFKPKNQKSLLLKIHCKTNDLNSTKEESMSNVSLITLQAMSAVFGGTESIDTIQCENNSFIKDRPNTIQLYLQEETQITKTIDPWAGSYYLEETTESITIKAWELLQEIKPT